MNLRATQLRAAVLARQVSAVGADRDRVAAGAAPHVQQRLLRFGRVVRALPAAPGVRGRENHFVVPDREPVLRIEETHPGEQRLGRHEVGLHPAAARSSEKTMIAAIPDRDQPLARGGERNEQRVRRQARMFGVRGIGSLAAAGAAGARDGQRRRAAARPRRSAASHGTPRS